MHIAAGQAYFTAMALFTARRSAFLRCNICQADEGEVGEIEQIGFNCMHCLFTKGVLHFKSLYHNTSDGWVGHLRAQKSNAMQRERIACTMPPSCKTQWTHFVCCLFRKHSLASQNLSCLKMLGGPRNNIWALLLIHSLS